MEENVSEGAKCTDTDGRSLRNGRGCGMGVAWLWLCVFGREYRKGRSKRGYRITWSLGVRQAWDHVSAQPPTSSVIVSKYLCNIHNSLSVSV